MGKLKTKLCDFNEETGTATYIYSYKNMLFEGNAKCHEDDMDINSKTVGLKYAELRAYLKYLKTRRAELQIRIETLDGIQKHLVTSKDFDVKSSYSRKLQFEICETRTELNDCKEAIKNIPIYLKKDIDSRDVFYKQLRDKRKKEES